MKKVKTTDLIRFITLWNPYCEHITMSTIFAKMQFNRGSMSVINMGDPGTGKSRSSLELVKKLDLGTEIIIDNTTTEKGLFEIFLNYPEQDIVIDECSTLLRSKKTQDMIKMSIESKPLSWTRNDGIQTTDPYRGNLIINSNVDIDPSVADRCFVNKTTMNREMILMFNSMYGDWLDKPVHYGSFINYLKKVVKSKTPVKLTKEEQRKILDMIQLKISETEQDEGYSRRIIIRELLYFKHVKKLFGKLDDEVFRFIEPFAANYVINKHAPGLIERIVGNGPIEKPELVKRIAKEGGYSDRHARRLIELEIQKGRIELSGKYVQTKRTQIQPA